MYSYAETALLNNYLWIESTKVDAILVIQSAMYTLAHADNIRKNTFPAVYTKPQGSSIRKVMLSTVYTKSFESNIRKNACS